jgi:nitroreductase
LDDLYKEQQRQARRKPVPGGRRDLYGRLCRARVRLEQAPFRSLPQTQHTKEKKMFLSLLEKRRSIRKYSEKNIEQDKLNALVESVLRSPSGKSIYPCEYIVVDDRHMLEKLSTSKPHGAAFLKNAPLGVVICADQNRSDTCTEDASIAAMILQLAAASLDLGSCWIQLRNRRHEDGRSSQQYVAELLGIPETHMVQAIMAIGYPAETKAPHKKEDLLFDKVYKGRFGEKLVVD